MKIKSFCVRECEINTTWVLFNSLFIYSLYNKAEWFVGMLELDNKLLVKKNFQF